MADNHIDENNPNVPAYLRKRQIFSAARQQLLLTALDRKDAGVKPNSKVATGNTGRVPRLPRLVENPALAVGGGNLRASRKKLSQAARFSRTQPNFPAPTFDEPHITHAAPTSLSPKKLLQIGETTHYIANINVAIIMLSTKVKQGDTLIIEGPDFLAIQPIEEMQIERKPVSRAPKGSHIGLKVNHPATVNGKVYKLA